MLLPKIDHLGGASISKAWPATVVVWGPGEATSTHAHHAIHFVLARNGTLRFTTGDEELEAAGIYVPGDLPHAIDARGADVVIVFVDPESKYGEGLHRRFGREVRSFDKDRVESLLGGMPERDVDISAWLEGFFAGLRVQLWEPRLHPGVRKALAWLEGSAADPMLEELANIAGLSPSRFSHVFKESVGLPPRTYLLWRRLLRAVDAMHEAGSLTEAAHQAGFADSAHMSRTFRRMFGSTPSDMILRSRNVQARGEIISEN